MFGKVLSASLAVLLALSVIFIGASPANSSPTSSSTSLVQNFYQDFLGRSATTSEIDYWGNRLDQGSVTQGQLATILSSSEEWIRTVIRGFYIDTLGREPDSNGYQYWINRAKTGMPIADIGSFFYGSDEYFNGFGAGNLNVWVTDLYQKLMLRNPDSGGLNFWLSRLNSGMTRAAVSHWFYQSPEKRGLRVESLYQKILGRSSDSGGKAYWAERLYSEGDLALSSFLASSPEYRAKPFVNRLASVSFSVSRTSIRPGDVVTVSGTGFKAGTRVELEIRSDPVDLGNVAVDVTGNFSQAVTIPIDIPEGSHTLYADGTSFAGNPVTRTIGVSLDRTGPSIDTVSPASLSNVYSVGDQLSISVTGSDLTGIQTMGFMFFDVTGGGLVQRDFCGQTLTRVSGSGAGSQTWSHTCTVPDGVIVGDYEIRVWAVDIYGNYTNMNSGGTDNTVGSFSITGGVSDRTGPSIDSVSPSSLASSFTVGDSLVISASGTDLSGIATMGFMFMDVTGGGLVQRDFCGQTLTRVSGSGAGSQTWSHTCTVPDGVIVGDYEIRVWAVDIYGNYTNMNSGGTDNTVGSFSITQ